jgi:hypothetical protein
MRMHDVHWSSTMDITDLQHEAAALVGTVTLPSPYPASGAASFVLTDWGGDTVIYVKIVQVVNKKRIITRFVKPEDIVAIRSEPAHDKAHNPETWPLLGPAKTKKELETGEKTIIADAATAGVTYLEELWHAAAILYVREAAPVLHRYEAGVTAAVSAESPDMFAPAGIPCCG